MKPFGFKYKCNLLVSQVLFEKYFKVQVVTRCLPINNTNLVAK
jgi:hypothetical protein